MFKDYADGKLSKDKYLTLKEDCLHEAEQAKQQITELESKNKASLSAADTADFYSTVERLSSMTKVTPEMLTLVERINVFDDNRIEIQFNFKDEFERICSFIK